MEELFIAERVVEDRDGKGCARPRAHRERRERIELRLVPRGDPERIDGDQLASIVHRRSRALGRRQRARELLLRARHIAAMTEEIVMICLAVAKHRLHEVVDGDLSSDDDAFLLGWNVKEPDFRPIRVFHHGEHIRPTRA